MPNQVGVFHPPLGVGRLFACSDNVVPMTCNSSHLKSSALHRIVLMVISEIGQFFHLLDGVAGEAGVAGGVAVGFAGEAGVAGAGFGGSAGFAATSSSSVPFFGTASAGFGGSAVGFAGEAGVAGAGFGGSAGFAATSSSSVPFSGTASAGFGGSAVAAPSSSFVPPPPPPPRSSLRGSQSALES